MTPAACYRCSRYVGCRTRINKMRKVKANHGSNRREDIRYRLAAMEQIAGECTEGVHG